MLSHRYKRNLQQIIPFGLIPMVFSILYSLLEKGILGDNTFYPATGNPYSFQLLIPALLSMLGGFLFGVVEVFYINKWFQKSSFTKKIISKSAIYLAMVVATSLIIVIFSNSYEAGLSPLDRQIWAFVGVFLYSFAFWSIILYFTFAVIICLFYLEVSDNIGQTVLLNLFAGRYHQPIEEERAYMFLDMKSSTTIAEQLGHVRYFKMLKEYYIDLSDPIIQYGGEIYQYVGDEVVVTWKLQKDFAANSLHCFFAMKESLKQQAHKYQSEYGVVPSFKAGIHYGKVTTGEIGTIKKDIAFSGDVLNTTARIQGLCNSYQVDLLVSEQLVQALESDAGFQSTELGEAELRGRTEKINLYTVQLSGKGVQKLEK